jgi:hypothetical protein
MLEQKINDLTDAINALTQRLTLMGTADASPSPSTVEPTQPVEPVEPVEPTQPVEPVEPAQKSPKPAKAPKEEPAPAQVTIKHDDVQEICLELMRFDRSLKPDVQKCIASFGGAQKLQDVSQADLPSLKAKLGLLR